MRCRHGLLCAKYSGTLPLRVMKEPIPLYTVGVSDRTGAAALPVGWNRVGGVISLQSKCLRALCAPAIKDGERSLVIKHRWSSDDA